MKAMSRRIGQDPDTRIISVEKREWREARREGMMSDRRERDKTHWDVVGERGQGRRRGGGEQ